MKTKKIISGSLVTIVIVVIIIGVFLIKKNDEYPINIFIPTVLTQNAFNYVPKDRPIDTPLLTPQEKQRQRQNYLQHYFFPWSSRDSQTILYLLGSDVEDGGLKKDVIKLEWQLVERCKKYSCYDVNYQPVYEVPKAIIDNMDIGHMPNVSCNGINADCYGIIVKNTPIRGLPTYSPLFASPQRPGEGYPFDYLQDGDFWLGAPVRIVQHTKDNQWVLVKGQGMMGWVPREMIAHANYRFRRHLERIRHYVTPIGRRTIFYVRGGRNNKNQLLSIYLGSIFPVLKRNNNALMTILIPATNSKGNAILKPLRVASSQFLRWPLKTSPFYFSMLINQMLDMPYGWGGLNLDSDCSGTLTRIYTAFGIWLVPLSVLQGEYGGKIYSIPPGERKAWLIDDKGEVKLMPYLTLITIGHEPDKITHVMMYLGDHVIKGQSDAIVFQEAWGIPIYRLGEEQKKAIGRSIFGRGVIARLSEGHHLLPAFHKHRLSLISLWELPEFNVTLLTKKPAPIHRFLKQL